MDNQDIENEAKKTGEIRPKRAPLRGRVASAESCILTITREEFPVVRQAFEANVAIPPGPLVFAKELSDVYELVVRRAMDKGNTAAAEAVKDVIEDFSPQFIFLVATAGGIPGRADTANAKEDIKPGDIVIADYVEYEFLKVVGKEARQRKLPYDHPSLRLRGIAETLAWDDDWIAEIEKIERRPEQGRPKVLVGNFLSSENMYGKPDDPQQEEMLKRFDKVIAVEQEAYGVGRSVFRARCRLGYNVEYLVVRGVSDLITSAENQVQRERWRRYATVAAAVFTKFIMRWLQQHGY